MLREPRSRLVAVYAGLVALAFVLPALPGGLEYRSDAAYVFWIVADAILIVAIARGSRTAAAIPLTLNVLGLIGLMLAVPASDLTAPALIAFIVLLVAQSAVLLRLLFWPRHAS